MSDIPEANDGEEISPAEFVDALVSGSKVQTFKAQTGTIYLVIASNDGVTLSLAPKLMVSPKNPVVGLVLRVRAQVMKGKGTGKNPVWDGFPELVEKTNTHASTEVMTAVGLSPTTSFEIGQSIANNKVIESMVDVIYKRLEEKSFTPSIPRETVVEYVRNVIEDLLPSEPKKTITDFPVCIGTKEISERMDALYEQFGK